jgi:hypothetical protein
MGTNVTTEKVTGVKFFKGGIDGKDIDSGKVFIEEALDFTRGTAKGYATVDYSLANAEAAKALMHNEFPLVCEVEMMRVTNGDTSKNIVVAIKPMKMGEGGELTAKGSQAAAGARQINRDAARV